MNNMKSRIVLGMIEKIPVILKNEKLYFWISKRNYLSNRSKKLIKENNLELLYIEDIDDYDINVDKNNFNVAIICAEGMEEMESIVKVYNMFRKK